MAGSPTGVFVGTFMSDWGEITRRDPDAMPLYQPTGSGVSMLAGRLSYYYDLRGPSLTVDTACSASFVALHSAVLSLRGGECSTALVGGVNSLLNHDFLATMSSMRFLSPDGRSYTYESRADGYARGEGVACLVLKRLDDALRDGDNVRAVIRGTGLNQDGKTPGITHPSGEQQAALIRSVYDRAGLDTRETSYVEAHGTGTQVGDVVEAKALYEAFGRRRTPDMAPLLVGSVKTNIGHVEGASGLAGLVKVVMMLERGCIVGNAGFTELNEKIKLKEWNMQVCFLGVAGGFNHLHVAGPDRNDALGRSRPPRLHQQLWLCRDKRARHCRACRRLPAAKRSTQADALHSGIRPAPALHSLRL